MSKPKEKKSGKKKSFQSKLLRMIEDYLKMHPGPNFASEIADALRLEFDVTFETIHKFLEEGHIKKVKP